MIPLNLASDLQRSAGVIIRKVCKHRMGQMKHPPQIEIDFVASLVENGAPLLEKSWQRILNPAVTVHIAGAFIHKSPLVTVKGHPPRPLKTQGCELADLLVVHSHRASRREIYLRGVLIQTKINTGRSFQPSDPQFWLYESWPHFVIRNENFHRNPRDFNGDRRSGQYGLVSSKQWLVTPPVSPMTPKSSGTCGLDRFLTEMLYAVHPARPKSNSRFGRRIFPNRKDDWSATIMELVENAGLQDFRHMGKKQGLYRKRMPRLGGSVAFLTEDAHNLSGGVSGNSHEADKFEEVGGFGVLVIATEDGGEWQD